MVDILTFGEPMIEFNQSGDGRTYLQGFGGDTSNVAIAATRQQARSAVMTALGDDEFGAMFAQLWDRERVDRSAVRIFSGAPTGIYFVTHSADGHRFSYRRAGSAASRFSVADIDRAAVERAAIVHISGITLAIGDSCREAAFATMKLARAAGNKVSLDTNLRLNLWPLEEARGVIHRAAGMADILLPGLDDAQQLTGSSDPRAIVEIYLGMGAKVVALTLGEHGALIATPRQRRRFAPLEVDCRDATGAGDTFDGAFLARLNATGDPFEAGRYANVAAALSTQGYGAVEPIPNRDDVEAALNASGVT